MNRILVGATAGVLALILTAPLALGGGHGGHGGGYGGHHGNSVPQRMYQNGSYITRPIVSMQGTARKYLYPRKRPFTRRIPRRRGLIIPAVVGTVAEAGGVVTAAGADDGEETEEGELPWQTVRYLRVNNRTGEELTVYVQLEEDKRPRSWAFAPGESAVLSIKANVKLAAGEVWIWAASDEREWTTNKEESLVLVPDDYQSETIQTFTKTFDP